MADTASALVRSAAAGPCHAVAEMKGTGFVLYGAAHAAATHPKLGFLVPTTELAPPFTVQYIGPLY